MSTIDAARYREVVPPEGVPLRFAVARAGDRVGAFLVDGAMVVGATVVVALVTALMAAATRGMGLAMGLLAFFLLRNFYFTWFECRWHGATPGKRLLGLRVIDAHGGSLTADAVFARNLMREVELFVPLVALLAPEAVLPDVPVWARFVAFAWVFVCALLPLFNRDRLRVGDLVAGTMVVLAPPALLREDLSAAAAPPARAALAFTPEQLDLYGIHELQVLESLLRQRRPPLATLDSVARRIQLKIGWAAPPG
ncbi:MAG TPA: RDD family protein, partial [Vicinamibacteria bacterium]